MITRTSSIPTTFLIGLGISTDSKGHVGIIYRYNNETKSLDLAWHHILRNEIVNCSEMDYFCCELDLEEENKNHLIGRAKEFTSIDHAPIPYGISLPAVTFDPSNNYKYIGGKAGEGLTCATFVMKFLQAYGYNIIEERSWKQRPDDQKWMTKILDQLEGYLKKKGHVSGHSDDLKHVSEARKLIESSIRFRPIEVFSSGIQPFEKLPIQFENVTEIVKDVIERIKTV